MANLSLGGVADDRQEMLESTDPYRGQGRTGGALELFQAKRQDLFEVLLEFVDRAALGVRAEVLPFLRRSGS